MNTLMPSATPILIGVTGGIGAGKSTLVAAFARHGATVFSADEAVRELYERDDVIAAVSDRWGDRVLDGSGAVDRAGIAEIVFTDPAERAWLESLVHPLVAESWERYVRAHQAASTPPKLIVAEVPLLFEAELEDRYDAIIAVEAPLDVRLARARARGEGASLANERASAQLSDGQRAARADHVFENVGPAEQADAFVADVIRKLAPGAT